MLRARYRATVGRCWVAVALLLLGTNCTCQEASPSVSPAQPSPAVTTLSGIGSANHYDFALELRPREPAVGQLFSVLTVLRDANTHDLVEHATLRINATMPEHGHGMTTAPQHRELGNGRYQSDGFKFHMPGRWVFELSTTRPKRDRLELTFFQPPTARH